MNRSERRAAAKKGDVIYASYGHLLEHDQNYGLPVECYVCGAVHNGRGICRIEHKRSTTDVPLCEACLAHWGDDVVRKFLNAPDLAVIEGGEATPEQINALADQQNPTEH